MKWFRKKRDLMTATRLLQRQVDVNARLRKKLRNQKEQLRALNTAILRKNARISNQDDLLRMYGAMEQARELDRALAEAVQ